MYARSDNVTHEHITSVTLLAKRNAANMLDLTRRQILRLLKRYRQDGAAAVRHKSRGRTPNNQIHLAKRDYALNLIKEQYPDFGPTLPAEMLVEHHGSKVCPRDAAQMDGRGWYLAFSYAAPPVSPARIAPGMYWWADPD